MEEAWNNLTAATDGHGQPADLSPLDLDSWGVVIGYVEDGHVSDQDAAHPIEALLVDMRLITAAENDALATLGFRRSNWSLGRMPHYDRAGRSTWAGPALGDADVPR